MASRFRFVLKLPVWLALFLFTNELRANLPVSGVPVPLLQAFDSQMQSFMSQYSIDAGVLAVSRNGVIIYQRGFGYLPQFPNVYNLPENTTFRTASCEKPFTAAAIRNLISNGVIDWSDNLFNLGQPGGGLLNISPWGGLGDNRLKSDTVQDAFNHQGGWDTGTAAIGDPQFKAIYIAGQMGIPSPPGRDNTIRYMLGQPLQYPPGTLGCVDPNGNPILCYSNFGYMVLGRIVEQVTGMNHDAFIRQSVVTPNLWVPSTEIFMGHTKTLNAREPLYESQYTCTDVYNPNGPAVACPYGGWDHESFVGHGNLVASALPLLVYMDNYKVNVGGDCGTPLAGGGGGGVHTGSIDGENACMYQRGDHINIVVFFNKRLPNDSPIALAYGMADSISTAIDIMIANHSQWPTFAVDGFWVDLSSGSALQVGGYNAPFHSVSTALASTTDGTKLRFQPGVSTWTGTINKKLRMDAPYGAMRIGG